jgi:MFS transporter, FLVCR family, MFS-domain-containing protein 7
MYINPTSLRPSPLPTSQHVPLTHSQWLSFSPVSKTASQYFHTSESAINWLSTSFLFAFCLVSPVVIYTLNKGGPKPALIASSTLILIGNWIRYAGAKAGSHGNFGVVMLGQILIGLAQPFVLSAPTRYSDLWFTDRGRVSATAVASLANPFGGALGQLIDPFWASNPGDIPNMILYIAILSTIASLPSFFLPSTPPTPPSASSHLAQSSPFPLMRSLTTAFKNPSFYLIFLPFSIYVGFFNSISSLLNQILEPYAFTENDAGIAGAILILVGLICAAITSPLADRYKFYLPLIKTLVPLIGLSYLIFIWAPPSRALAYPYVVLALLGASSFALVPVVLEFLVEMLYPVSPEVSSTACWTGGQLMGAIFIIVSDALKDEEGKHGPKGNMSRALIFQAVVAIAFVPLPLALGLFGRKVGTRRLEVDRSGGQEANEENGVAVGGES